MTVLNIAIAVDGLSEHWLGGVNYFRNLVTVFDAAADPGLRLHLLTDEPGFFNDLHPSPRVMVHALGMLKRKSPAWVLRKAPQERPVAGGVMPRPYVLFIPGGSAHRLDKRWPVDRYGELGKILYNRGFDIVILGGPQESAEARQIQRYVGKARDLTGRTDFARIAILGAKAALVVGNDTGRADHRVVLAGLGPQPVGSARPCGGAAG